MGRRYNKMYGFEKCRKDIDENAQLILTKHKQKDDKAEEGYHKRFLVYIYNSKEGTYYLAFKNTSFKEAKDFYDRYV